MRAFLQIRWFALLTLTFSSVFTWAILAASPGDPNAKDSAPANLLLREFEQRYQHANTLSATFLERYSENGALLRAESGTAYFLRPGKMRWQYESPEKNLFLVDGKFSWFYAPADHTATKLPVRQSDDLRTPFALLAGEMKLSRICEKILPSAAVAPQISGNVVLECKIKGARESAVNAASPSPEKPDPSDQVFFELAPNSELARILVRSPGGIQTEFVFKDWQFNPSLAAPLFRFEAPPGVVIVNGLLPSAPGIRP